MAHQNSLKPPKLRLFELGSKPLEEIKIGKIKLYLKIDTQDQVPEVLSSYKYF